MTSDHPNNFSLSLSSSKRALQDDPLPEAVRTVQDAAFGRLNEYRASQHKSITSLIVVAIAIQLFNAASIASADLGPFKLSDLSFLQKALPVLAAYCVFDIVMSSAREVEASQLLTHIDSIYRPRLYQSPYGSIVYPAMHSLYGYPPVWLLAAPRPMVRIAGGISKTLNLASIVVAFALLPLAYIELFSRFGAGDSLLWVSLFLAGCFSGYALLLLVMMQLVASG